jgi:hypothetical protein
MGVVSFLPSKAYLVPFSMYESVEWPETLTVIVSNQMTCTNKGAMHT